MDEDVQAAAARLVRRLKEGGHTITVAESCTGGLLASAFTDIAGASQWFNQSWVTYSNDAKVNELGVSSELLERKGAVSAEVAIAMARGAVARARAGIAISITGIAGPANDGTNKKVGMVYVGIASSHWANAESTQIGGNRAENKIGFVHFALLTAIRHYDKAMEMAEENQRAEHEAIVAKAQAQAQFEIERAQRDAAARQETPWKDDEWKGNEELSTTNDDIESDIEW
jgi:nicotinamide-nucleotide amidase